MADDKPTITLDAADILGDDGAGEPSVAAPKADPQPANDEGDKPEPKKSTPADKSTDTSIEDDGKDEDDKILGDPDAEDENQEDDKSDPEGDDEDQPKKDASTRKEQLQTEIRGLVSKRNELRTEVQKLNEQVYRTETKEELVDQGMDEHDAAIEAMKQENEMKDFNARVTDLNANLNIESLQVLADFPVFDPDSSEFDKELADRAKAVYERAAQIKVDPKTGLVVSLNVLPYDIYKAFAETKSGGVASGQVKGQKSTEKMMASAEPRSSAAPKAPREDAFRSGLLSKYK